METASQIRNTAAHAIWGRGQKPNTISPHTIKAKGGEIKLSGYNLKQEEFTPQRFVQEAEQIDRLTRDFQKFFTDNFGINFLDGI